MLDKIFSMMGGDGKTSPTSFSLENDFIKPFENAKKSYTRDEYSHISSLMSDSKKDVGEVLEKNDSAKAYFSLIKGRAEIYKYKITDNLTAILLLRYKGNLAIYTMILSYIAYVLKNKRNKNYGSDTVDLYEFYEIFREGFPDENDLQKIWNKQKYYSGNMLDTDNVVLELRTNLF